MSLFKSRSNLMMAAACAIAMSLAAADAHATVVPLFEYHFTSSDSFSTSPAAISDVSGAGNDGQVYGEPSLSTNVPAGAPAGSRSLSLAGTSTANQLARTAGTALLNNTIIAADGGFTEDIWINPSSLPTSAAAKLISYGGWDDLILATTGKVQFGFNNAGAMVTSTTTLSTDTWTHITLVFDTTGQSLSSGTISGVLTLYINGAPEATSSLVTKGTSGDASNRNIGIGRHPTSGVNYFAGLIYDPTIDFGVVLPTSVPTPAALPAGCVLLGLLACRRRC